MDPADQNPPPRHRDKACGHMEASLMRWTPTMPVPVVSRPGGVSVSGFFERRRSSNSVGGKPLLSLRCLSLAIYRNRAMIP